MSTDANLLLHDRTTPCVALIMKDTLHAAYAPALAPPDYHSFRSMQHGLAGTRFRNTEQVRKLIDDWIAGKRAWLEDRWLEFIKNDEKYFD